MLMKWAIYLFEKKEKKSEKKNSDILKFLVSIRPNIGFLHRNVTLVVAAMCKMLVKETIYLIGKEKWKKN